MKVFINAGHGGNDPGAVSKNGTKEKDINLTVSSLLAKQLIALGYDVEFYQQKKSLTEVAYTENSSDSDLFISIHCNSATNPNATGLEVLYHSTSVKGKKYAQSIQEELVKYTNLKNRGIKPRTDLHVLKKTFAPAVLVELAFLSNVVEEKLLTGNPEMFATGIVNGIRKIL